MGNLADMQSALVDYIEMQGLAGYAAKEANETIAGSVAGLKAAWDDFVTGLADPDADIGQLMTNIGEQFNTVVKNVVPVAERVAKNIPKLFQGVKEEVGKKFEEIYTYIKEEIPNIDEHIVNFVDSIGQKMSEQDWGEIGKKILSAIVEGITLVESISAEIDEAARTFRDRFIESIKAGIPEAISKAPDIITLIGENIKAGAENIKTFLEGLPEIIHQAITEKPQEYIDSAIDIIHTIGNGFIENLDEIVPAVIETANKIRDTLIENAPQIALSTIDIMIAIAQGLIDNKNRLNDAISEVGRDMIAKMLEIDWHQLGKDIIESIVNGLKSTAGALIDAAKEAARNAYNSALSLLGLGGSSKQSTSITSSVASTRDSRKKEEASVTVNNNFYKERALSAVDIATDTYNAVRKVMWR